MVRAIDMQQVITQAYPVEKVQQTQQQHPETQQRYFDLKLNEEQRLLRERVKNLEETRGNRINEKEEGQAQNREAGKRKESDDPESPSSKETAAYLSEEGTIIDIKA